MVLRFLDSRYPAEMQYEWLEKIMETKVNCFPRELARVLAYFEEKQFVEGKRTRSFGDLFPKWITVKITANGIDYLEKLEESIRLKVEETEKEMGFKPYSQKQGGKEKKDTSTERTV